MKVVTVAKTHMGENICVGVVSKKNNRLLRLIPIKNVSYRSWSPSEFKHKIGSVLEIEGKQSDNIEPPHFEDYIVSRCIETPYYIEKLSAWIEEHCVIWKGNPEYLSNSLQHA